METIKANTKRGQAYIYRYNASNNTDLMQCYRNPSTAKTRADYFCRAQMIEEDGNGYKVISYNCNFFTVAWRTKDGNGLRVETAYKSILVQL